MEWDVKSCEELRKDIKKTMSKFYMDILKQDNEDFEKELKIQNSYYDKIFKNGFLDSYLSDDMKKLLLESDKMPRIVKNYLQELSNEAKLYLEQNLNHNENKPNDFWYSKERAEAEVKLDALLLVQSYFSEKQSNEYKISSARYQLSQDKQLIKRLLSINEFEEFLAKAEKQEKEKYIIKKI
jgi:hypothetical protein